MLKVQIALIAILIASVAFVSCDRAQQMLDPVVVEDMRTDMKKILDAGTYTSWAHVALPAPTMTVAEAAEAGNAAGTGAAHNPGSDVFTSRTVYINEMGAMANKAGATEYPAGTIIFKAIMDETETFVDKVAMMTKSDDEMYTGHGGWRYEKYARPSEDGEYMQVRGSNLEDAGNGCHGCHAKADTDSVFVSLPMDDMSDADMDKDMEADTDMDTQMDTEMPEDDMPEHMPETDMDTDMPEAAASDPSDGHGDGHGHTGDGDTGDAGNGDAGPDADEEAVSIENDDVQ